VTAIVLSISRLDTGRLAETAVLCVDARYVSIRRVFGFGICRLHPSAADWKAIAEQLRLGLAPGPLAADSPIALAVTGQATKLCVVQYVSAQPIDATPFELAAKLDGLLVP
jgi:hypothetical protein